MAHAALKRDCSSWSILNDVGRLLDALVAVSTVVAPASILSIGDGMTAG